MGKLCILLLALTLGMCNSYGQTLKQYSFQLNGTIDVDTGTVSFYYNIDSSYYPKKLIPKTAMVKDRKFTVNGMLPYPVPVQIIYAQKRYMSGSFMLCPGSQSIIIAIDSNKKTPQVSNVAMKEYSSDYVPYYKASKAYSAHIYAKGDSLSKMYNYNIPDSLLLQYRQVLKKTYVKSDSTFLAYTRTHHNSYLALWHLADLMPFGYEPIFDTIYQNFSAELKSTPTGKLLGEKIRSSASLTALGKLFPVVSCIDANEQPVRLNTTRQNYTFVDFWYSNCSPCIAQFDGLKAVYHDFKSQGLEIIGISTDKINYKKNWLNLISSRKLNWLQYWDKNGIEAKRLNIGAFPTNFLLNSQGKIIAKNLSYVELREFLTMNLKGK
jgi:peroxiredoxin